MVDDQSLMSGKRKYVIRKDAFAQEKFMASNLEDHFSTGTESNAANDHTLHEVAHEAPDECVSFSKKTKIITGNISNASVDDDLDHSGGEPSGEVINHLIEHARKKRPFTPSHVFLTDLERQYVTNVISTMKNYRLYIDHLNIKFQQSLTKGILNYLRRKPVKCFCGYTRDNIPSRINIGYIVCESCGLTPDKHPITD
jgi:hypothetical protein